MARGSATRRRQAKNGCLTKHSAGRTHFEPRSDAASVNFQRRRAQGIARAALARARRRIAHAAYVVARDFILKSMPGTRNLIASDGGPLNITGNIAGTGTLSLESDSGTLNISGDMAGPLKLFINHGKSRVVDSRELEFLGFSFRGTKIVYSRRPIRCLNHNVR